jgi:serine/threonine-protein kinase
MMGRVFLRRYEAVRLLGEGGMGCVYLARDSELNRQVVVKVMHDHVAADPKFRKRFEREIKSMARFQHPYAVTLYDASLGDPQGPCIIMEYIKGVTLDALLAKNGRLSPRRAGRMLQQTCEVLQVAHNQGIIHRDLKPPNLMVVDPETPYEKIKVMDFGLAKMLDPANLKQASITGVDFAVGTPAYICPEQVRGEEMDHRGDIYSVGVILYELLTGCLPFAGRSSMEVLLAHATENPPTFLDVGAADWVPPAIEAVVQKCLAKDPGERPQSALELAEAYDKALSEQEQILEANLPPPPEPAPVSVAISPHDAKPIDPNALVYHLDAWMPERIAAFKLRGFVHDVGGDVIESVPGLIRVRLGERGSAYGAPSKPLSWFGIGRRPSGIDIELRLEKPDPARDNLHIMVLMRSPSGEAPTDPNWRARCDRVYCDLRAYLMGTTGSADAESRG